MFEHLTDQARKILELARYEALKHGHPYIGTEHIALGLLLENAGGAKVVLLHFDITPEDVRQRLELMQERCKEPVSAASVLPFTPRARVVIDYAKEEAAVLNHEEVGTAHILLGLLREGEGIAAQALKGAGLILLPVREAVASFYSRGIDEIRLAPSERTDPRIQSFAEPLMLKMPGGWFKAANAIVVDRVTVGEGSNIWFACVLRGDIAPIRIGRFTNIQDLACVHVDPEEENVIGDYVSVAHHALIHGKRVGDCSLIGMHAILMGGSVIGEGCIIAAGAIVTENKVIPPRSLVIGMPGKVVRQVTDEEYEHNKWRAMTYYENAKRWHERNSGVPDGPLGRGPGK